MAVSPRLELSRFRPSVFFARPPLSDVHEILIKRMPEASPNRERSRSRSRRSHKLLSRLCFTGTATKRCRVRRLIRGRRSNLLFE
jgi:hypothetical protein